MLARLRLDAATGELTWQAGTRKGRRAGYIDSNGYRRVLVDGRVYAAHRLVWRLHYGVWPNKSLDHINGDRDDNRPTNLRLASPLEQMRNRATNGNNTSGFMGVTWSKSSNKWQATIKVKGRLIYLGVFAALQDAANARKQAEQLHGFHPNHGRRKVCALEF